MIDPTTNTIYLTAKTKDVINGNTAAPDYVYQLYAINISNGRLQTSIGGGVVEIGDTVFSSNTYTNNTPIAVKATTATAAGQVNGAIKFNALRALDRSGLTLANGQIYLTFASHGDNGPYHGWVVSYKAANLQLSGVFNATPGDTDGGTWQSGGKIEVDSSGALYFETGNGGFDSTLDANGFPVNGDYGDVGSSRWSPIRPPPRPTRTKTAGDSRSSIISPPSINRNSTTTTPIWPPPDLCSCPIRPARPPIRICSSPAANRVSSI